jgi:cysteine-rich repeat protein
LDNCFYRYKIGICSNGGLDPGEEWDDGNLDDGDGWDSSWQVELNWQWPTPYYNSASVWFDFWGDGNVVSKNSNVWDDGNVIDGDGCSSTCTVENGYEWKNYSDKPSDWKKVSTATIEATAAVIVGVAMAASVAASIVSLSPPSGLWQAMNMMQLFLLLLLFRVYLPDKIKGFISSSSLFSLSFKLSFLYNIPYVGYFLEHIDFEQGNSTLKESGVISGNIFTNIQAHLFAFTIIALIHLIVIPLRKWDPSKGRGNVSVWFRKLWRWMWKLFTLTLYIRTMMQSSQFFILVSVSGVYNHSFEDFPHTLSFTCSILILLVMLSFMLLGVFKWSKQSYNDSNARSIFNEYFSGLKKKRFASFYNLLLILRRLVLISWLIWCKLLPLMVFIPVAWVYQLLHLVVVVVLRPFDHPKENFVEIINELIFTVLVWGMAYLTEKGRWSGVITNIYYYLMMSPGILIFIVSLGKPTPLTTISLILGFVIFKCVKCIIKRKKKVTMVEPKRIDETKVSLLWLYFDVHPQ